LGELVRIQSFLGGFEAHFFASLLSAEGIRFHIRNEGLAGLAGAIPLPDSRTEVWVDGDDEVRALEILERMNRLPEERGALSLGEKDEPNGQLSMGPGRGSLSGAGDERACTGCGETSPGEFDVCWNCGAELPG
jgi:hypothetical protein